MKPAFLIIFTTLFVHFTSAQTVNVSGNCFLTGQTDHSGVEVTYQQVAPGTTSYTFTTNAGGGFIGTIDEGVYDVTYHKPVVTGYCGTDIFLDDYALYADSVFVDTTMIYGIGGNLSGTYGPGVFIVACDITVSAGNTLELLPGTTLLFAENRRFDIEGDVLIEGSNSDSISFLGYQNSPWIGIFKNKIDSIQFSFCNFRNMTNGVKMNTQQDLGLIFNNCHFTINNTCINYDRTGQSAEVVLNINKCVFSENTTTSGEGIIRFVTAYNYSFPRKNKLTISNSLFYDNYGLHNTANGDAAGITIGTSEINLTNTKFQNNLFDNVIKIDGTFDNNDFTMKNCVFSGIDISVVGIYNANWKNYGSIYNSSLNLPMKMSGTTTRFTFYNCIIYSVAAPANYRNSNLLGNCSSSDPNIGNWVTTNNGYPADGFGNISETPLFVNATSGDLRLQPGSPGIDCGNNNYVNTLDDLDGNTRIWDGLGNGTATVDMGAYEFGSGVLNMNDVSVVGSTQPNSSCALTNAETIEATIRNFGTNDASGFNVSYSIDNGATWTSEVYSNTLQAGDQADFQFTQTADMSAVGVYDVLIAVDLAGDAYSGNDTLTKTIETYALTTSFSGLTDPSCAGIGNGTATINVSGAPAPYSYLWDNATNSVTQSVNNLSGDQWYHVNIVTATGCSAIDSVYLTEPTPITLTMDSTNATCLSANNDGEAIVTATGGTGSYSYLWDDGASTTSATLMNMTPGQTYTVTVTDGNGCTANRSVTLNTLTQLISGLTSQDVSCAGAGDGSASISPSGGTGPYTISWYDASSGNSITNLSPGSYNVYIEDANGCFVDEDAVITEPVALSAVFTDSVQIDCFGNSNGSLTITPQGGTKPYSYTWDSGNTDSTATGLSSGMHLIDVTDANGCLYEDSVFLSQPSDISILVDTTNNLCFGEVNGALDITVSGGTGVYSYSWNNNATTQDIQNLAAGFYTVVVTDNNGCSKVINAQITQPSSINLGLSITNNSCFGDCNGSIEATISGGTSPYLYDWSNGSTNNIVNNLCAGNYQVEVTDVNGCTAVDNNIQVGDGTPLSLNITTTPTDCDTALGTASVYASGGVLPYSYLWSNGSINASTTDLAGGLHAVTVSDNAGCSITETFGVNNNGGPQISLNSLSNNVCGNQANGSIDIEVSGGSAPYTYQWSTNNLTQDISNLSSGPYEVTVRDANNCITTGLFEIVGPNPISVSIVSSDATCNTSDGSASVVVSGGVSPYQYSWSNGGTSSSIQNLNSGIYSVIVNDAAGCQDSIAAIINDNGAPSISVDQITPISCANTTGSVFITASGANNSYLWSNGATTEDLIGVSPGTYDLSVTDLNGCMSLIVVEISDSIPPTPPICLVTVNDTTNTNLLVWEKDLGQDIAYYNIYRESSQAGVFNLVRTQPFSDLSQWTDSIANPMVRGWRYGLTAVNSCGVESEFSDVHKTMHLTINQGLQGVYNLIWDEYEGFGYGSYDIYRHTNQSGLLLINTIPASLTSYTDNYSGGTGGLYYLVEVIPPSTCTSEKAIDHNSTRSNKNTISGNIEELSISVTSSYEFNLFPNPMGETLIISTNHNDNYKIELCDVNGRTLLISNHVGSSQIDVNHLHKGIYFVKIIINNENIQTLKVIK